MTPRSITLSLYLACGPIGATAMPAAYAAEAASAEPVKNIVLVHGLFADGSSWSRVIPLLQAKGLHVTEVQNPTTSLDHDVAAVNRVLAQQDGPVILVGHSYGGMVIMPGRRRTEGQGTGLYRSAYSRGWRRLSPLDPALSASPCGYWIEMVGRLLRQPQRRGLRQGFCG